MKPEKMHGDTPVGIAYSRGASSEYLIRMIEQGVVERPDKIAVFCADPGAEHDWSYERELVVEIACQRMGIPFIRCRAEDTIVENILAVVDGGRTRADHPPFWTENPGGGRGQVIQKCTRYFKTAPIRREASKWLKEIGEKKAIDMWIGFSSDEEHRATKAIARQDVLWERLKFPAVRLRKTREQQRADLIRWTGSAPQWSACTLCPFNSSARWQATTTRDLEVPLMLDEKIRNGMEGAGIDEPCYLSDQLIPLDSLLKKVGPQQRFPFSENPGCDSGRCFL